ncbi:hypothetical protein QAD02_004814 [Eretmocerus hayati]|uniref:Uncharacterized protein n=1 Tax=Eretmocerus hayati TaxID=131215 RepID=A0ACC2NR25_9HYME|nr:hypothetical protein QAD02_004814 [Eretmocerus hayati]
MRKSSTTTTRRRSSSNPGKFSQDFDRNSMRGDPRRPNFGGQDSGIPRPRMRSSSTDRLSGMRKSNLRPTTGPKLSFGQYTTASSAISPMPSNRFTHALDRPNRQSHADQASTIARGQTPSNNRHVVLTSNDARSRASSAERANALVSKGPKKDSRPLGDKNFLVNMVNKIDSYFHSMNQSGILNTNGSIKPLSLKIFVEATDLLLKLLDMKQLISSGNYVEEIPKVAKKLYYPAVMNKSWLKTANTPHNFPQACGWISWLVELCEVKDIAFETFTFDRLPMIGESEEEKEKVRNIFIVMIECYKAWNDEQNEEEDNIMQQFLQREAHRRGISSEAFQQVKRELEEVQLNHDKEKMATDQVSADTNELQEILSSLRKDRAKQEDHILEQQRFIDKTTREIEQLKKEKIIFTKDIEQLEITNQELNSIIKKQPMSVDERDKILKCCSDQQTFLENFEAHLEEMRKEAYTLDLQLSSSNKNLTKTIFGYNQALFLQFSGSNINIDDLLMPEDAESNEKVAKLNSELEIVSQDLSDCIDKREAVIRKYDRLQESAKLLFHQMQDILDQHHEKIQDTLELYVKEKEQS